MAGLVKRMAPQRPPLQAATVRCFSLFREARGERVVPRAQLAESERFPTSILFVSASNLAADTGALERDKAGAERRGGD